MTYPTIMPALTLDFANGQQLDPRITFSRSSSGTYVDSSGLIKTAADNVARFDHDSNGKPLGLLIEESRTNEVVYSEDLTQTNWGKYGVTITSNAINAPDGLTTADKMFSTSGAALLAVQQAKTGLTNAAQYSRSVFFKAAELTSATMQIGGTTEGTILCVVDLSNGTSTGGGVVTAYSNGWYKVERTFTMSGTTNDFYLRLPNSSAANSGVYVWGVQLEAGSFPTSYISTAGSTVTRAADIALITGNNFSSWYGGLAGTYTVEALNKTTTNQFPIVCDNGTTGTRILFATSGAYQLQIRSSGSTSVQLDAQPAEGQPQGMTKYAGSYSPDGASIAYGGVSNTDTSAIIPQCSRLQIAQFSGTTRFLTLSRISYYNERLTDAELQTLTS